MSTIGERIKLVRKSQNPKMNQQEFGATLGATRDMIKTYELGQVIPKETFCTLLCQTYHVNYRWLDTGEGEMFVEEPDLIHDLVEKSMGSHDKRTRKIIERFLRLPPETRNQIIGALEAILAKDDEDGDSQ